MMIQESFALGDSLIHRLDPRVKILFATLYSVLVALCYQFSALLAALGISLALAFMAHFPLGKVARRLAVVNGFVALFWLVLPLTSEGAVLYDLGPVGLHQQGVEISARITLKSNAIVLALMAMIASSAVAELGHAMHRLRVPPKMVHLFTITYRYIFVLAEEYQRLTRAAKVRGFYPRTNMNTYRTYAYLMGMLFVRALERGERVHQAMLCRGFQGRFYSLRRFSLGLRDWAWSGWMTVAITGLAVLEWTEIG